MPITGSDFAVTLAINGAIGLASTLAFAVFRNRSWARKFYAPKEYLPEAALAPLTRPDRLRPGLFKWIPQLFAADGEAVMAAAGVDAWTFVRVCHLAIQLFTVITLWCGATCLVVNLLGKEVATSLATGGKEVTTSYGYTYWEPTPDAPKDGKKAKKEKPVDTPDFFVPEEDLPRRPPGLDWKQYRTDVPPLDEALAVAYLKNATANKVKSYTDEEIARFVFMRDQTSMADDRSLADIDKATIANVADRSPTLWVHALTAWVVTATTLGLLAKYSREAVTLRLRYLSQTPKGAETHSVLVTDVPGVADGTIAHKIDGTLLKALPPASRDKVKNLASKVSGLAVKGIDGVSAAAGADVSRDGGGAPRGLEVDPWGKAAAFLAAGGTPEAMVEKEFNELYPGEVAHVQTVYNTSAIDPLLAEYSKLKLMAEDLLDDYVSQKRRGVEVKRKTTTVRGALAGAWGRAKYGLDAKGSVKVDAVQHCLDRMEALEEQIKVKQGDAREYPSASAFVTFKDRRTQVLATQALHHHDTSVWKVAGAPSPEGVLWPALARRSWERSLRFWGVWVAFAALCLLYLIPVGAIQKWVQTMGSVLPSSGPFKIVGGLLTGLLPPLVLVIFIALMPPILRAMGKVEGAQGEGELDRGVITKFFIFQLIVVFFGSFIGGAMFDTLKDWGQDPKGAVRALSRSVAGVSTFFLNFVTIKALFAQAFKCLRIIPFAIYGVRTKLAATERSKARVWSEQYMIYGVEIPSLTVVLLLGIVFCTINPMVPAVCLIYFATTLFFQKYRVMYVARRRYESGGLMWAQVFMQVVTALFLYQIVTLGLLGIKQSRSAVIVLPLIPLTALGAYLAASIFRAPLASASLRAAVDADAADLAASGNTPKGAAAKMYVPPGMAFDGSDLAALKREAAAVDAVVAGRTPLPSVDDEATKEAAADAKAEAAFKTRRTMKKRASSSGLCEERAAPRAAPSPFAAEAAPATPADVESGLPASTLLR